MMNNSKKIIQALMALLLVLPSCNPAKTDPVPDPEPEPGPDPEVIGSFGAYKHVIILGVDGAGAFFGPGVTPNTYQIFKGAASSYTARCATPSISAQCWGSMLHGVPPVCHRLTNSLVGSKPFDSNSPYPSIFRIARESLPYANLVSICNWNPINIGIIEDYYGVVKETAYDDEGVTRQILAYLEHNYPTLMFVQFDSVDEAGHAHGYGSEDHLQALGAVDGMIARVFEAVKAKGMLDDTLFIVSTDHGGTPDGSHGGDSDAEMNIFMGIRGKTVADGQLLVDAEGQDIAAITAHALGLEIPESWTSRVPTGVFVDVEGTPRKQIVIPVNENRKHATVPTPDISKIRNLLKGHDVIAYLPFDGDVKDACGITGTTANGKQYYYDAYFGKGVDLEDGYVTLNDVKFGTGSFSVAFWIKTDGASNDPSIISNKDWRDGGHDGFVFSLRPDDMKFNAGSDALGTRMDGEAILPLDYKEGWMHVVLAVDRTENQVRVYYDFKKELEFDIPSRMRDVSFDAHALNIGQDGLGTYSYKLSATLDEMIVTADVLSETDIAALKAHYR